MTDRKNLKKIVGSNLKFESFCTENAPKRKAG